MRRFLKPLFLAICTLTAVWIFNGCRDGAIEPAEPGSLPAPESVSHSDTPDTKTPSETQPASQESEISEALTDPAWTEPTIPETESAEISSADETEPNVDPVEALMASMTLQDKIWQLFVVTPEALTGSQGPVTVARETTRDAFDRYPVGGILYMGQNLENPDQVKTLCGDMQTISRDRTGLPAFLCVDEEGGTVARISGTGRFGIPGFENMSAVGAAGDVDRAAEIGRTIGAYLSELGFNVDFAPDADVLTNPANTVVRLRSFGSDPELVTNMASAYAEELLSQGVLPTYKHFPGHGATAEDSHEDYASSPRTREELLACELAPFWDASIRGIPLIMVGHITLPKLTDDGLPASLSPILVTELLRGELGYRGLIITDALDMGAISNHYSPGEAAVLALLAGNDLLLLSDHLQECGEAVLDAVRTGEIPEARIDESVSRILQTKLDLP